MKNCFLKTNKFRAWYKPDFKEKGGPFLFELKVLDYTPYFVMKKDKEIKYEFQYVLLDNDWIVERGTGLKDNKGKEIFEGDIVEIRMKPETKTSYISNVVVNCMGVRVACHPAHIGLGEAGPRHLLDYIDEKYSECKIIGNIHQNKGLLK